MSSYRRSPLRICAVTAIAAIAVPPASRAQEAPADSSAGLEPVVVTGTRIRRQDQDTASPVSVLSSRDIAESGQLSLAEIFKTLTIDGQGTLPTEFLGGYAAGAAAISLRGLGVDSTLVLLNGRRLAPYGAADDGARSFIDLNSMPLEAIDRVEVLKDGASSIYGSDAIGGVVNIILRKSYQGATLTADAGTSDRSDGSTGRIAATFGVGDLAIDRYNVYLTLEGTSQDQIRNSNRPGYIGTYDLTYMGYYDERWGATGAGRGLFADGSGPAYVSGTPYGTVRVPGGDLFQRTNVTPCPAVSRIAGQDKQGNPITSNICLFDQAVYRVIQPHITRVNMFARASRELGDGLLAYTELGWFSSRVVKDNGTGSGVNDGGVYDQSSPTLIAKPHVTVLGPTNPQNPYPGTPRVLNYLAEDIPIDVAYASDVTRAIVGLEGKAFADATFEVGAGYVASALRSTTHGKLLASALQAAINDGSYRINDPAAVSAGTRAAISPTLETDAKNSLMLVDAALAGSLSELRGGKLGFAVGAEWRRETTDTPSNPYIATGQIIGGSEVVYRDERKIYAGYAELDAPLWPTLDVTASFRHDHYSDYGTSDAPKVGVKFTPLRQVSFRGTYSKGFQAPGPAEVGQSVNPTSGVIGNPQLKPETSTSEMFGVVIEPFIGTRVSVDHYQIGRRNDIVTPDQSTVLAGIPLTGAPNSHVPGALPGSLVFYNADGSFYYVAAPYENENKTTTSGLDVDVQQKFDGGSAGTFTVHAQWTYVDRFDTTLANGTTYSYAGTQGPYVLSADSGTPRNRGGFELSWARSAVSMTGHLNYVDGMKLIDHHGEQLVAIGDGTYCTTTCEGIYFVKGVTSVNPQTGIATGAPVCGVYNPDGTPYRGCRSSSFWTFDLSGRFRRSSHLELSASVLNVTNRLAPFNPYSYGGLNYNPSFTQAGAVGRFMTIGGRYTF